MMCLNAWTKARSWMLLAASFCAVTFSEVASAQTKFPPPAEMHAQIAKLTESGNARFEKKDHRGADADYRQGFLYSQELSRLYQNDPQYEPYYREQCFFFLERVGANLSVVGQTAGALEATEQAAAGYEEMAADKKTPESRTAAAELMGRMAWLQLLLQKSAAAEASSQKGLGLDPNLSWIKTNLAHAKLLNNQTDAAMSLYKAERTTALGDGRTFEKAVLDDFSELEKAGLTHAGFNQVRALYGAPLVAQTQTNPSPAAKSSGKGGSTAAIILIGGILLAIGGVFWFLLHLDKKRRQKIEALATSWGWTCRPVATKDDWKLVASSQLANRGHSRYVSMVIELPPGAEQVSLFDFVLTEGRGKSKQTFHQTVASFTSSKVSQLPTLVLKPESLFDKMAAAFGGKDINFPERPAFSKKYLLKGEDETAIRQLFSADVISFFENERKWVVEILPDRVLIYQHNVRVKPDEMQAFVDKRREIFALLTRGM